MQIVDVRLFLRIFAAIYGRYSDEGTKVPSFAGCRNQAQKIPMPARTIGLIRRQRKQ